MSKTKEMTHIGRIRGIGIRGAGDWREIWLRQTPKFWFEDGHRPRKWPKERTQGGKSIHRTGTGWSSHSVELDLDSVRLLTRDEKLAPLMTSVESNASFVREAQERLDGATDRWKKSVEALNAFTSANPKDEGER